MTTYNTPAENGQPMLTTHDALVAAAQSIKQATPEHNLLSLLESNNGEYVRLLANALEKQGFRKIKFFKAGLNSILFETAENQLLRICSHSHQSTNALGGNATHPAILQPIAEFALHLSDAPRLVISVMPKVRTNNVKWEHIEALKEVFEESGINVRELNAPNIGLIDIPEHGIFDLPVLIDTGTATGSRIVPQEKKILEKKWRASRIADVPDGTPWQNIFDPRIGTGRAENVVNDEQLAKLEENLGAESTIIKTLEAGGYVGDVAAALGYNDPKMTRSA